jgi:hypothetical protein
MDKREEPELLAHKGRIHESLGVRLFKPTPERFDPTNASARELLLHGYPARPDVQLHPTLHEQWKHMLSQPISIIEPQFGLMAHKADWSHLRYGLPAGNGWSGGIVFSAKGDTVTFVSGQWSVPHPVSPKPGDCICAEWVGIDGANGDPNGNDSYDILQAGTTQMIVTTVVPLIFSFAWFEWFPAAPVAITNLEVSPGDTMYCAICVYSPTEAGIHMLNVTTRIGTSFVKTAPPNNQLVGNCAEWILEDPVSSNMNLARFGDVYFDNCVAGTEAGALLPGGTGRMENMYDINGHGISIPYGENDLLIRVEYADQSP